MCTVRHQLYIQRGTEAIPRARCSRPQGSEQKERWGRFGPAPPPAGFGVRVHPPRRGAPDRCLFFSARGCGNCWKPRRVAGEASNMMEIFSILIVIFLYNPNKSRPQTESCVFASLDCKYKWHLPTWRICINTMTVCWHKRLLIWVELAQHYIKLHHGDSWRCFLLEE